MATYLTKEKKQEIFKQHTGSPDNTGSIDGQIALFTYRIEKLSDHLRDNRKDFSCKRSLLTLVGQRKRFLNYMAKKDIVKYRELINKLGLRK